VKKYKLVWYNHLPWLENPSVYKGIYEAESIGKAKSKFLAALRSADLDAGYVDLRGKQNGS
jgi:hypothetical protein